MYKLKMNRAGTYSYCGIADRMARLVQSGQLKDRLLWTMLTDQFVGAADAHDMGWRGEFWGKLMRGACMTYIYTRDAELYDLLENSVRDMLENADVHGRFSTYSIVNEFNGWDVWTRKYVLLGFLSFFEICKDEGLKKCILSSMKGHLDYIILYIGKGKLEIYDTSPVWQGVNSASILEPVVMLYNLTGERTYLDFAGYIVDSGGAKEFNVFETAYENKIMPGEYPVRKAYELMSCFEGLIEYYKVTGEEKWRIASENFVKAVIDTEITAAGGAGCEHECFNGSRLMQTFSKYDGLMQETCVTVTWMKLCYKLLCLTGNSMYADEIERSAYNALYGAVNTLGSVNNNDTVFDMKWFRDVYDVHIKKHGPQMFDSYSPLIKGTRGRAVGGFRPMRDNSAFCGCCIAIGAAGTALVPNIAVMEAENGFVFNFYMTGVYRSGDFEMHIRSDYPFGTKVEICIKGNMRKEIRLRRPYFSNRFSVTINDRCVSYEMDNGYAVISCDWCDKDKINIELDMNPRVMHGGANTDDKSSEDHAAFMYGPLLLALDARISEVGGEIAVCDDNVSIKSIGMHATEDMHIFEVGAGEQRMIMTDYASAGNTWDTGSEMEAWIKTKRKDSKCL